MILRPSTVPLILPEAVHARDSERNAQKPPRDDTQIGTAIFKRWTFQRVESLQA